jgi:hypothetical protein
MGYSVAANTVPCIMEPANILFIYETRLSDSVRYDEEMSLEAKFFEHVCTPDRRLAAIVKGQVDVVINCGRAE